MNKKDNIIIYNTVDWKTSVSLYSKNWDIWMNQNQIAELFDTSTPNISMHIKNIFEEWELSHNSVIKDYLTTASDWKDYNVKFYSLKIYHDKKLLSWNWSITNKEMKEKVKNIYEIYNEKRKKEELILEDEKDLLELEEIEKNILKK